MNAEQLGEWMFDDLEGGIDEPISGMGEKLNHLVCCKEEVMIVAHCNVTAEKSFWQVTSAMSKSRSVVSLG